MKHLILIVALALGACANGSPEVTLAAECQGYASALRAVTLVKHKLTPEQVTTVDTIKSVNGPICHEAATAGMSGMDFDYQSGIAIVLRATRQLATIGGTVQ